MSTGAWGARHIDPKIRDAALEAARRHGWQIGSWLNEAVATVANEHPPHDEPDEKDQKSAATRRMVDALDRLAQRLETIEQRSSLAVVGLDRSMSGLANRLDDTEVGAREEALRLLAALGDLKGAQATLEERFDGLEREQARQRAEDVSRAIESRIQALAQRIDEIEAKGADTSAIDQRLSGLDAALTAAADESAARVGASESRLNAKIMDVADAIEEHFSTVDHLLGRLEETTADTRTRADGFAERLEKADAQFKAAQAEIEGLAKRTTDIGDAQAKLLDKAKTFHAQQNDTAERVKGLEGFRDVADRRLDALARTSDALVDAKGKFDDRLDDVEKRIASAMADIGAHVSRVSARIDGAENASAAKLNAMQEALTQLEARVGVMTQDESLRHETEAMLAAFEGRFSEVHGAIASSMARARAEFAEQIADALESARPTDLETAVVDVNRRIAAAEKRQAQTIEAVSVEIKRLSEAMDRRLRALEDTNGGALGADVTAIAERLQTRFQELEGRQENARELFGVEVARIAESLEKRLDESDARNADAIEQISHQVQLATERTNQRQDRSAKELSDKLLETEERAAQRLADVMSALGQRLAEIDERAQASLSPLQKAMGTLAARLHHVEDGSGADLGALLAPQPAARPFHEIEIVDDEAPRSPLGADVDRNTDKAEAEAEPQSILDLSDEPREDAGDLLRDNDDYWAVGETDDIVDQADAAEPLSLPTQSLAMEMRDEPDSIGIDSDFDDDEPLEPKAAAPAVEAPAEPDPAVKEDYIAAARRAAREAAAANARGASKAHDNSGGKPRKGKAASSTEATPKLRGLLKWGMFGMLAVATVGGYVAAKHGGPIAKAATARNAAPGAAPGAARELASAPAGSIAEAAMMERAVHAGPAGAALSGPSLLDAAEKGDSVAQYELALQQFSVGDSVQGLDYLKRAADQGLAMAQYRLAKLYERGDGIKADLAEARRWTERAALAGNRAAMHDLGVYYAHGEGAPRDEAVAFRWFRQAAELGMTDSQFNLGVLYQVGRGVPADPAEALFWFKVAAKAGDADAKARAELLLTRVTPEDAHLAEARSGAFQASEMNARANGEFGARSWAAVNAAQRRS